MNYHITQGKCLVRKIDIRGSFRHEVERRGSPQKIESSGSEKVEVALMSVDSLWLERHGGPQPCFLYMKLGRPLICT